MILIYLFQVLILKRIDINPSGSSYFHFIVYPIVILMLPVKTPKSLTIIIGFIFGLAVDMFYDSPGVHASALTFIAFIRPFILKFLEPVDGYSINAIPSVKEFKLVRFFIYGGILLFIHLFFYFSVEAFSFVYIFEILIRSIASFIISIILLLLIQIIINR